MTAEDWLPWIPFILTLITAILGNIPDFLSHVRQRRELETRQELERVDDDREALTAITSAGATVTKQYQELLGVMRSRMSELEDTLSDVKTRLTQAEEELKAVRADYEDALATIERLQGELEAAEAGGAAWEQRNQRALEETQALQADLEAERRLRRAYQLGYHVLRGQLMANEIMPKHDMPAEGSADQL